MEKHSRSRIDRARRTARHVQGRNARAAASQCVLPLGAALMAGGLSLSVLAQLAVPMREPQALPTVTIIGDAEPQDGALAKSTRVGSLYRTRTRCRRWSRRSPTR